MALNYVPVYPGAPVTTLGAIATANLLNTGAGTLATLFTASASGSRLMWISFSPQEAITTDEIIRLFLNDGGANYTHLATIRIGHLLLASGGTSDDPYIWVPKTGFIDLAASYVIKGCSVQGFDFDTISAGYSLAA
jgi:hypothetical protein